MGEDVLKHLPHGEPFRFLTRVVSLAAHEQGEAVWSVSGREDFFRGHFPGDPIVPGVLINEALAQLSGIVGLHGAGPGASGSGRLIHVDMRYDGTVRPPAEIMLRSRQVRAIGALRQFEVSAHVGEVRVARGTLALAAMEAGQA